MRLVPCVKLWLSYKTYKEYIHELLSKPVPSSLMCMNGANCAFASQSKIEAYLKAKDTRARIISRNFALNE